MPRTTIYIAESMPVREYEFKKFFKQYSEIPSLDKIYLCRRLNKEWLGYRNSPKKVPNPPYRANLPAAEKLSNFVPREKGIYAIFANHPPKKKLECFYVGISATDVYQRLVTHLRGDIRKNYRNVFGSLKRASKILICYSTIPGAKSKSQLVLLEDCMTAKLRPDFLSQAAK